MTSWVDFAGNLKNEASIINFIAAYGTHALITGADDARRQARRRAGDHHRQSQSAVVDARSDDARSFHRRARTSSTAPATYAAGDARRPRQRRPLDRRPGRKDHAVRRHARLDLQLRLRSPDGEAAERRPLLLPAAPRRPAPVRRDGEQLLRRDDHAQHRRHPSAVGRVLHARPDPRGRPGTKQYNPTCDPAYGDRRERRSDRRHGILTPLVDPQQPGDARPGHQLPALHRRRPRRARRHRRHATTRI